MVKLTAAGCVAGWLALSLCSAGSSAQATASGATRTNSAAASAALASFRVEPGFRIELVAGEPLVSSPVAAAFDERGRLFVAEMEQTSGLANNVKRLGEIRLLEEADEHGQFQTSKTFAEDIPWPSALACYAGGVFVAATPDILYLKDTTGDGTADQRHTVLSGFGGTNAANARRLLNNFNWGLNARIYGGTAGMGGLISASNWPGPPLALGGGDFSFNSRTLAVFPETGPAVSGLSFDSTGRKFVCDYSHPLRLAMYEARYWLRNPFFAKAPGLSDVASPATPLFRAAAPGQPGGETRTNSQALTWLTNAQGLVVYRGNIFPTNYAGNVFVCDPEAHVVHRLVLSESGVETVAARPANERNSEFLSSSDSSFRPVQALNGPDGALYIVHGQAGNEKGRIYRIVPEKYKRQKPPEFANPRAYDLIAAFASPNGWQRETAARLLFERQDPGAVPLLGAMLTNSPLPHARVQALYALAGAGALNEGHVLRALQENNPYVRQHALIVSEALMINGVVPETLWNQLKPLVNDPSIRVRYQLAFTLGAAHRAERPLELAQLFARDPTNEWIQTAVLSSLGDGAEVMFRLLGNDSRVRNDPNGFALLRRLAGMIGTKGRLDEVSQAVDFLARGPFQPLEAYPLIYALGEGLNRTRSSLALVDPQGELAPIYRGALTLAVDDTVAEAVRVEAVRMLGVSPYSFEEIGDWLLLLCNPHPLTSLRAAAIETLARYDDPRVLPALLDRWSTLPPVLRRQTVMLLLARSNRVGAVLAATEKNLISRADFPSIALNFLRTYRDPSISERATRLFGPVPVRRPEALEQFRPALRGRGMAERGREIFVSHCAGCHEMGREGRLPGPDLTLARTFSKERLLSKVIEPHAQVLPEYATCVVETESSENLIGIKTDDNPVTVTLVQAGGASLVWPRLNARSVQTQSWSLMPDGLEQGLTTQDMANLLEYFSRNDAREVKSVK